MNKTNLLISLVLAMSILGFPVGRVFAAPALQHSPPITGTVQRITLETEPTTGITIVIVEVAGKGQALQIVRISQKTAEDLELVAVVLDGDGKPVINNLALGQPIEIDPATVLPNTEEKRHPVGDALTTFFSDIAGLDYNTIMTVHEEGAGFGVIAQALWLTTKLGGNSTTFQGILEAKKSNDYSTFTLADGTVPKNWGELRKAILDGDKKNGLGLIMPTNHGNNQGHDQSKDKNNNGNGNDKGKDKNDSGNGSDKNK